MDSKIPIVHITPTRSCNLACGYCEIIKNPKPSMSVAEWERIIDCFDGKLGFVHLFGGEIMLYDGVIEFAQLLNKKGIRFSISTNCSKPFYTDYLRLVDEGCKSFVISLDSIAGGGFDKHSAAKSLNAMRFIEFMKSNRPEVSLLTCTVVSPQSLAEIRMILNYARHMDCLSILTPLHYRRPMETISGGAVENPWTEESLIEAECLMRWVVENYNKLPMADPIEFYEDWLFKGFGWNLNWKCVGAKNQLFLDSDGSVFSCFDYKKKIANKVTREAIPELLSESSKANTSCPGCFWSCLWLADKILKGELPEGALK